MKKLQRSGQAHFLSASSPDSSPSNLLAVPLARVLPNVSLLAGYIFFPSIVQLWHVTLKTSKALNEKSELINTDITRLWDKEKSE